MPQGHFIIYKSLDEGKSWEPVMPVDVPAWIRDPDVLGRLAAGYCAHKEPNGVIVPDGVVPWYRAERAQPPAEVTRIEAARAKRLRRQARNLRVLH